MAHTVTYPRRQFEWYDVVELSGPGGRAWMEEYRRHKVLTRTIADSLLVNRQGRLDEGTRMLAEAGAELASTRFDDPSIHAVVARWYYGALGYSYYRREEFDDADATMAKGHDVVAGALGRWDFLVFLADEAVDFRMHRARIARNRQRWREMREHLGVARAMREGTLPYHVLPDGTSIGVVEVRAFLNSLPIPEGARVIAPHLQDEAAGWRHYDLIVREIVRLPGFVVYQP